MPTVKLVVIGASGVGKTSLRSSYISGQFSDGYRATIGADFIVKAIPHPSNPADKILLQIWDTAGQERFSSLSKAFFRGADAVLLLFDVNSPATMTALIKWWAEFREQAPLADEDTKDFCCVVVGNKIDVAGGKERVTEADAATFLTELVPSTISSSVSTEHYHNAVLLNQYPLSSSHAAIQTSEIIESPTTYRQHRSDSIAITSNLRLNDHWQSAASRSSVHPLSKSRSPSGSHFYGGTMTTTHTTLTIYHTPSSSLFDLYQSARSSPEPWSSPSRSPSSMAHSPTPYASVRGRPISTLSDTTHSTSSISIATITPSLFARESGETAHSTAVTADIASHDDTVGVLPPPPARGPKLFFTSAKTGAGVSEVFEYIARRVVRRWEYEERLKARRMYIRDSSAENTVQLDRWKTTEERARTTCCSS
ncbi:Ras-related protein Rab7 [Termitomyces sp. T112]|nr:Ras-related protein Rab7 [Termitomyces sp. T112]